MRPYLLIIILFVFVPISVFAQKQNNNWCFGLKAGVSFNTNPPSSFTSNYYITEGVATVSNRHTGALMFYCSGNDIYNANGVIMPNGNSIGDDPSGTSSQGVVVVPFMTDTNKYYVFTVSPIGVAGELAYSILDMRLDAGRGDIITGQKRIPIDSGMGESMFVADGCGIYWLIAYKRNTQDFHAYRIDANGLYTTPVVSPTTGYLHRCAGVGCLKVSPDRTKLALAAHQAAGGRSFLAVHDFDQTTGVVSNGMMIDDMQGLGFYGCEFSPNGQLLYCANITNSAIYQYDVTLPNAAQITASRKTLTSNTNGVSQMQIAPDSNIYCALFTDNYIARITNPNAVFPGCTFTAHAVKLDSATESRLGLPQAVVPPYTNIADILPIGRRIDTFVCENLSSVVLRPRPNMLWYRWQDTTLADSFVVKQPGTYWVTMPDSCYTFADTFVVSYWPDTLSTKVDTVLCSSDTLVLWGRAGMGPYTWQDSTVADTFLADTAGKHWASMDNGCFTFADTFDITIYTDSFFSAIDTQVCGDTRIALAPVADRKDTATYIWSTGEKVYSILKGDEGAYWVYTLEKCKVITDTIHIKEVELIVDAGADTSICYADTITLMGSTTPPTPNVEWSTGDTVNSTKASAEGNYTFTAVYSGCKVSDKVFVDVIETIRFELGSDTEVCRNDRYVLPQLSTIGEADYLWQDGSNNRKYIVQESGRYTLSVSNQCETVSDTVDISVRDCNLFFPSAFTPNGDGHNDIARFVGDLTNVYDFELRIFNRRGQEVYATTNINDGWDGMHNGQPAAMTTYYYYIKYTYLGEEHLQKGDLTLIR